MNAIAILLMYLCPQVILIGELSLKSLDEAQLIHLIHIQTHVRYLIISSPIAYKLIQLNKQNKTKRVLEEDRAP